MTVTEVGVASPAQPAAELEGVLDERRREILERRRRGVVVRRRGWLVRRALATADVVGLTSAFVLAVWLFGGDSSMAIADRIDPRTETLLFLMTLPGWVVVAKLYGLYDRDEKRTDHSTVDDFGGVFHMITVGTWLFFAGAWATNFADPQLDKIVGFWGLAILLVCTLRATARAYCHRQVAYLQNTVIVGAGDVGQLIAKKYLQHPEYGITLVGFVDADPKQRTLGLEHVPVLGDPEQLRDVIELLDIERVVVAFSRDSRERTIEILEELHEFDVQVDVVPRVFEAIGPGASLHDVEGITLIGIPPMRLPRSTLLIKRSVDVVAAAVGLFFLAPVLGVLALLIRLDGPGPIFYRHDRIGKGGGPIRVLKFRTMHLRFCRGAEYGGRLAEQTFQRLMDDAAMRAEFEEKQKLSSDPRITKFGAFLRRTSLDELPQLWNVLKGDISLVGPRPIMQEELERYGSSSKLLLDIKPGVTGYWQINGRSATSYEDRVRLDMAYVGSWSLGLDLTILAKTVRVLLGDRGAY